MQHNYFELLLATSYIRHLEQLAIDSGYSSQEACDYTVHNLIAALREDSVSLANSYAEDLVSLLLTVLRGVREGKMGYGGRRGRERGERSPLVQTSTPHPLDNPNRLRYIGYKAGGNSHKTPR
jgi:hypothetical protein